ncbi:hypothetical protein PSQ90_15545 [Devosia rhodophyticola]|uniref:Uncharacterized protein n=1 Tax=Devosia rhodophyticola TaxID=3026423 RepID=A0ABY7YXY6_9HYPH|nr:hypothetical protein [Devosia rhodophyticola]WDR05655.1 hypothetical protein PSQ90_15545 [Devosia rhodophyticola]
MTSYTNRWFLKRSAALFCAAILLFGLSASAFIDLLLNGKLWFPKQIDQGWATLIGAVVGLSIVALQARIGLRNLRQSQVHQASLARLAQHEQAQLDREARRDQFELQTEHDNHTMQLQKKALAAALNGELLAVYTHLNNRARVLKMQQLIYESIPKESLIAGARIEILGAPTPIFDASIPKMGLLEPSLISDIVELFQNAKSNVSAPADKITAEMIATTLGAVAVSWEATRLDFLHLQKRLIAVQYGSADPGARVLARQEEQGQK